MPNKDNCRNEIHVQCTLYRFPFIVITEDIFKDKFCNADAIYISSIILAMVHYQCWRIWINSLFPAGCDFKCVISTRVVVILFMSIFSAIICSLMTQDPTGDKSTLIQGMAWCCPATCHYLSQCWPRSVSPYGITRLEWVKWKWLYIFLKIN